MYLLDNVMLSKSTFLIILKAQVNIFFIIKVKILMLSRLSCRSLPPPLLLTTRLTIVIILGAHNPISLLQ